MTRRYARAEKGQRAYGRAPASKGKNVTLVGALSISGLMAPMTWQGGTDGLTFLTYVEQVLVPTFDFSPIENCWSKLKESLRAQAARTYDTLNQAISIAIDEITKEDIVGWFTHCCYCGQDN